MAIWDSLSLGTNLIGDIIGVGQQGFNLWKDINNVDVTRQKDAQLEINQATQAQQFGFNKALAEQAHGYNQSYLDQQQKFNAEQLQKQFNMNAVLGSAAREAMQMRAAGLNPQAANGSASVSLASSSSPSMQAPSVSAPSSSVSPSHYSPGSTGTQLMQALQTKANIDFTNSQTRLNTIEELWKNSEKITDLMKKRAETEKALKDANKSEAETKVILGKFDDELQVLKQQQKVLQEQANFYNKSAGKAEKEGQAAVKNADTAEQKQKEEVRHNKVTETLERARVRCDQERVNFQQDVANAQVEQLHAAAERDYQEGNLTKQKAEWYGMQIFSEIYKNISLSKEALAKARLENMTADEYKAKIAAEIAKDYAQAAFYSQLTIFNVIGGISKARGLKGKPNSPSAPRPQWQANGTYENPDVVEW